MSTGKHAALAVTIGALVCPTSLSAAQTCDTERYPLSTVAARFQQNDDGTLSGVVSPAEDRYLMSVIATASNPRFQVSRADVDRDGYGDIVTGSAAGSSPG